MEIGQHVKGEYCGLPFSGEITALRPLTVPTDGCLEYMIKLDAPMMVFGTDRNTLVVYAKFDGSPSSYTKHTDFLA